MEKKRIACIALCTVNSMQCLESLSTKIPGKVLRIPMWICACVSGSLSTEK
jgi:hypothetical protein